MTLSELFLDVAQRLAEGKCTYICFGLYDIRNANADDTELVKLVNTAGEIIMDPETAAAVKDGVRTQTLPAVQLRGFSQAIEPHLVID